MDRYYIKIFWLFGLILLLNIPSILWAQNQQAPTNRKTFDFSGNMSQAKIQMDLTLLYQDSYRKTKVYKYLQLSAGHNLQAISIVNQSLPQISRTTKFYNIAVTIRTRYCKIYQRLRLISSTLAPELYLSDAPAGQCN